jgi:hypothetical protein
VNYAHNKKLRAQKERRQARSGTRRAVKELGEDTPTEFESSTLEEEEEGK